MSYLVALEYPNRETARVVRDALNGLRKEHVIELRDAVVAEHRQDGKVKLDQLHDLVAGGALSGAFWGALIGLLFGLPVVGLGAGLATGALGGAVADIGIDDSFAKESARTLTPGSAVLFILFETEALDRVLDRLRALGGTLHYTNLSRRGEQALRDRLEKLQPSDDSNAAQMP